MQDRSEDYDEPNDYDRRSEELITNMEQSKKKFIATNMSEMTFDKTKEYSELKLELRKSYVNSLYEKLSKSLKYEFNSKDYNLFDFDDDNNLIYKDGDDIKILTKKDRKLKSIKTIATLLGVKRLQKLGFENVTTKIIKELPTRNEIIKATPEETIALVDRTVNTITEIETSFIDVSDRGIQTSDQFSLRELKGLDKSMQTISGSLTKAVAEKIKTEIHIDAEYGKLKYLEKELTATDKQRDEINDRITILKDRLEARNDEIKILKDKFSSQVTQIKETFKKLNGKTLGEKIRILFREQGITIATILTAIGMTIGFLIELLIPKSVTSVPSPSPKPTPKPTPSWIKNKLEALKNLLAKLAEKAGAALPGIIGSIVSWILNRVKDVVGFIAKETWILIVGIGVILIESIRK